MSQREDQHKSKKRNDIQCLRAIAIIGVLLFHLFPKQFVNGFLGVDTFFVLSGYLMASILSREATITGKVVATFYTRRFKRIVPLYSIMLAILAVVTPLVFLPSDITHFVTDLEWALPFAENMQNVLKQFDYWDEVFSSPVLLHAWSLGVEIQYYLIVPLIMTVARFGETRQFRLLTFAVIMTGSYVLHLVTSSSVSFGLLFSRVWQFLTGSVFFELEGVFDENPPASADHSDYQPLSDKEKLLMEEEEGFGNFETVKPTKTSLMQSFALFSAVLSYLVTGYMVWMVIMSSGGPTISRFLVTFATGTLLLYGKFTQNPILSNEVMVYIGDLSYNIYLAHWPVIILYKYYNDFSDLTMAEGSLCALVTLLISIVLHHSLERLFIQSSTTVAFVFVSIVYVMIVLTLLLGLPLHLSAYSHQQSEQEHKSGQPDTAEAISYNQQQSKVVYFRNPAGCVRDFEAERWTGYKGEAALRCVSVGNGTAKVLVLGNSYGYRAFTVLHRLFAGRYAQMRMFTKSSRVLLTKDPKSTWFAGKEKIVVENFQPDITFLIEKDSYRTLMKPLSDNAETDPITMQVQEAVSILSQNSGTVVIDSQYYKTPGKDGVAYTIQKRLQLGRKDLEDLSVTRKDYEAEFANENARMATIKHKNVIVNDVQSQLCPSDRCYFFNRTNLHSYYGDAASHLTTEGLKSLEPKYSEIIEDFLLRLASRTNETAISR